MTGHTWSPLCSFARSFVLLTSFGVFSGAGSAVAQSAIRVDPNGNVGIGTTTPAEQVHIVGSSGVAKLLVQETAGGSFEALMELENQDGDVGFRLRNPQGISDFNMIGTEFRININSSPAEMSLSENGNLFIRGTLTTGSGTNYPDFVFESDYELMPLDALRGYIEANRHLPGVTSAKEVDQANGVNMSQLQLQLLQKVEELTLYILQQQRTIEGQETSIRSLEERLQALQARH